MQEHVSAELPQPAVHGQSWLQPERGRSADGARLCAKNTATFAPMRSFSAVETGPGPNENEDDAEYREG